MTDKARELFRAYQADTALVRADPELTDAEKMQEQMRLTNELLEAERAAGIQWVPIASAHVENATTSGFATFNREQTDK